MACELHGGRRCVNHLNCALRSVNQRCLANRFIEYTPVADGSNASTTPAPSPSTPIIDVGVTLPGVTVGIKL